MDYNKAIAILNLTPNFTEEELKKNYRKLSHQYHPDKWEGKNFYQTAMIKQQEINEAKDFLTKYLKNNPQPQNRNVNQFDRHRHADEKLKHLKSIVNINEFAIDDDELKQIIEQIKIEIFSFETDAYAFYTKTKESVDALYESCVLSIRNLLKRYVTSFYKKNYIDQSLVEETINYDCNIEDFYNQLLKIKEKYSKEVKVQKLLEIEIEQYKKYAGYDKKIEFLVKICKNNTLNYLKQNDFKNIEIEITKMHQKIKQDIFEVYYALTEKILQLEISINEIKDESIRKQFLIICSNFEKDSNFNNIKLSIQKLELEILKYQEIESKKQKQKENEEYINNIYQTLITKYSEIIKQYNIITENTKIKDLNEYLNKLLQIFLRGIEEFQDLDFFELFNNITLINKDIDKEIITKAIKKLNKEKNNQSITSNDNGYPENKEQKRK